MAQGAVKKVVLAYSGGLDTSIILKWLQETYGCEIVTFTADLGQGEELAPARDKALKMGVKAEDIFIDDLREEFVRDFVWPMFRANTLYEGLYLLGTSIARPLIAKRQIEIANMVGADAVCHGATGKGNDQVRFEVSYYALKPDVKVIAPWREWEFEGRPATARLRASKHGIRDRARQGASRAIFDRRQFAAHVERRLWRLKIRTSKCRTIVSKRSDRRTITPEEAPDQAETVTLSFERGDLVAINNKPMKAHELLAELNRFGARSTALAVLIWSRTVMSA
jgi:argininosuccinate synthase